MSEENGKIKEKRKIVMTAAAVLLIILIILAVICANSSSARKTESIDSNLMIDNAFKEGTEVSFAWSQSFADRQETKPYEAVFDGNFIFYLGKGYIEDEDKTITALNVIDMEEEQKQAGIVDFEEEKNAVWENLQLAEANTANDSESLLVWDNIIKTLNAEDEQPKPLDTMFYETLRIRRIDTEAKTPHLMRWGKNLYWFAEASENAVSLWEKSLETGETAELKRFTALDKSSLLAENQGIIEGGMICWISDKSQVIRMDLERGKIVDELPVKGLSPDSVQCNKNYLLCTDTEGKSFLYSYPLKEGYFLGTAAASENGWQVFLRGDLVWMLCGDEMRVFDLIEMKEFAVDLAALEIDNLDGIYVSQNGEALIWSQKDCRFAVIKR